MDRLAALDAAAAVLTGGGAAGSGPAEAAVRPPDLVDRDFTAD